MPITFSPQDENHLTHVSCWGLVTIDDMRMTFAAFMAQNADKTPYRLLVDLRAATEIDVSFRDIAQMIGFVKTALRMPGATIDIAIFAPRPRDFAIARMFQIAALTDRRFTVSVHNNWFGAKRASHRRALASPRKPVKTT